MADARVLRDLAEEVEALREALRAHDWFSVYLDGRNEHGSHVLPLAGGTIVETEEIERELECQSTGTAERIIAEAEAAGFSIGMGLVTRWSWVRCGDEGGGCWEYARIDPVLTAVRYGTPEAQRARALAADLEGTDAPTV